MGKKEKIELVVLCAGIIGLVLAYMYVNKSSRKVIDTAQVAKDKVFPMLMQKGSPAKEGALSKEAGFVDIRYTGRQNRDPLDNSAVLHRITESPEKKEGAFPKEGFSISAIIWGGKRPQAIINDKVVNIGDKLSGGEIVGIDKKGVRINFKGKEELIPIK
jgi:hypothetical protein